MWAGRDEDEAESKSSGSVVRVLVGVGPQRSSIDWPFVFNVEDEADRAAT
jgi:hypothetical protein